MPALAQLLVYLASASAAFLTCVPGVDPHNPDTGAFSLVLQLAQEAAPRDILNRTGQPVVLDHPLDVQVLHSDQPVTTRQVQRHLEMMLAPQIRNASMRLGQLLHRLAPVLSPQLLPADRTLLAPQLGQCVLEKPRILEVLAIGRGQEVLQAHVYADGRIRAGLDNNSAQVAGKDGVPAIRLALDPDGLDLALDLAMYLDLDEADRMDAQLAVHQLDAIAVGGKLDRSELGRRLEARIPGLLTAFDAKKERLERFVQPPERGLATAGVEFGERGVGGPQLGELGRLVAVVDVLAVPFPSDLLPTQCVVVEAPVEVERELQAASLIAVGVEQKLKGAFHALLSLLIFDVFLDGGLAGGPDSSSVIAARPEGRKPGPQAGELLPQDVRGVSLEPIRYLGHTKNGVGLDKQVHVIGADAHLVNLDLKLLGLLPQKPFEALFDPAFQDRPSILRTPYHVVLEGVDGPTISSISSFHALDYIIVYDIVKAIPERSGGASSVA